MFAMTKFPPSIFKALPSTKASATLRRAVSTLRPKVARDIFICSAACS
jgi:hypothetical protein